MTKKFLYVKLLLQIFIFYKKFLQMKTKIKNTLAVIKAWDKKNTNFHSMTYMNIFLLAAAIFAANLNQAAAHITNIY